MIQRLQTVGIAIALIVMSLSPVRAMDNKCVECGMMVMMDSPSWQRL